MFVDCIICGAPMTEEFGHNPSPVVEEGRSCTTCNFNVVIPARLDQIS